MTHPHSAQRTIPVSQSHMVVAPHQYLVNAPVLSLDSHPSVLIPAPAAKSENQHRVINGEVITSRTAIFPARAITATEPKQSLLRRTVDDPYWILMTLAITLIGSITAV